VKDASGKIIVTRTIMARGFTVNGLHKNLLITEFTYTQKCSIVKYPMHFYSNSQVRNYCVCMRTACYWSVQVFSFHSFLSFLDLVQGTFFLSFFLFNLSLLWRWQACLCGNATANGPSVQPPDDTWVNIQQQWNAIDSKSKQFRVKPAPVPLCQPQISHSI
jgi:hypothetical protein